MSSASSHARLCAQFVATLPVQHAAISTLGDPFEIETVCATDPTAARLDELQLDSGVGPCWQALASHAPVLVPDVLTVAESWGWPTLHAGIEVHGIRSAYAFPMTVGSIDVGAVDLYSSFVDVLTTADVDAAVTLADATALHVLRRALERVDDPPESGSTARRVVHQATGMVIAQLRVSAEDALLIIRAHAFATDRSVHDVASDIIERAIDFAG